MATTFKKLDVRPLIAKGTEPFAAIRAKIDMLKSTKALPSSRRSCPSPLIEKLRSEGFRSSVIRQPGGAWAVNFWRDD